jgi:polysaccharide chain length determinant protein (PEP-CTERM system associated)
LRRWTSTLQKRTSINVKGSDLFTVSIVDRDPRFAQGFTNRLIGRYLEENLSAKREETYGANRFLDEQLVHFKSKLDEAEDAIIAFRKNQGIYLSLDERSQLEDIKQYQREIENIALNLDTLLARKERLTEQLKAVDPTVAIFGESQQEDRIAGLEKRLAQLLLSYTENYPEVVRLKVEIEGIKRMAAAGPGAGRESLMTSANPVHQEVQQKSLEVEAEISALQARQKRLRSLIATREGELQNIPENRKQLAVLEQERDSYRKLYEELLARMGQSEVSKQMEIGDKTTNFRVVDPAVLPILPVSPNMLNMLLLAIAGGLGAGLGAAMLRENLDHSIKNLEHLQQLKVEVLAVIPRIDEPQTVARRRRLDLLAYGFASVYMFGVVCLLAYEAIKRAA